MALGAGKHQHNDTFQLFQSKWYNACFAGFFPCHAYVILLHQAQQQQHTHVLVSHHHSNPESGEVRSKQAPLDHLGITGRAP